MICLLTHQDSESRVIHQNCPPHNCNWDTYPPFPWYIRRTRDKHWVSRQGSSGELTEMSCFNPFRKVNLVSTSCLIFYFSVFLFPPYMKGELGGWSLLVICFCFSDLLCLLSSLEQPLYFVGLFLPWVRITNKVKQDLKTIYYNFDFLLHLFFDSFIHAYSVGCSS
jgi:hypothetical protein